MKRTPLSADEVKQMARDLGADLVGIASADVLNAFPPDPRWPQTPDRTSPYCRSVVVIALRIPVAVFRAKLSITVQCMDQAILRRLDKICHRLVRKLEGHGWPSLLTMGQETDFSMKNGSYGRLSTRHLGFEAGLGTLGLDVNLLTPEYGPRVYLAGILTELELEADGPMTEQVCIGESCSRCLHSCPTDAVLHFGLDKRACATAAQEFGYGVSTAFMRDYFEADVEGRKAMIRDRNIFGLWQGLLRVAGSFGDCPRCMAVCPVGNDYHAFLAGPQKVIPEKTDAKVAKAKGYKEVRRTGGEAPGLDDWNIRWVGPDGYQGIVGRELKAFKKRQAELAEAAAIDDVERGD
jgi:ferredoxin